MGNLSKILLLFLLPHLVFMGLFVPLSAQAGFFSVLLGDKASASTSLEIASQTNDNSQSMALLETNSSFAPIFDKKSKENGEIGLKEDTNNISGNALLPISDPLSVGEGIGASDSSYDQVSVYVVRKGDTLFAIADMFGVSVNTILWANDMKKGDKLTPGSTLFILPVSGIEHEVVKGQTLKSIAKLYKVEVVDIVFYNNIAEDAKLAIGDKLMIPGAEMADEGGDKPAPNLGATLAKDKNYYETHPIQSILGYFINPVPVGRKTQGLHGPGHRGIDIGAPKGTPIYASASGTVLIAKIGWSGGYGNMAIVQHLNGTKTLYAHMTKIATHTADEVVQGEVIGYVGSTGHSTGPHLHFEVFNAKNPGADWSWKN